jgi:hypothetical protein
MKSDSSHQLCLEPVYRLLIKVPFPPPSRLVALSAHPCSYEYSTDLHSVQQIPILTLYFSLIISYSCWYGQSKCKAFPAHAKGLQPAALHNVLLGPAATFISYVYTLKITQ